MNARRENDRAYRQRPLVGVGAAVFDAGRVLLVRRAKPPKRAQWSLPGGAQELGETVRQAALREVREETGITAEILELLDVVDFLDRDRGGEVRHHYTLVDFLARRLSGEPAAGDDVSEARWLPLARLAEIDMWEETRRVICLGAARLGLG